tara:strand:- start:6921 stop:7712 length:792 start_codon:yes stop_codon:yes gene_type:complete
MINAIILTCLSHGSASVQLAELIKSKKIKIKSVVLSQGNIVNKRKYYKRKIKKAFKIGLFGVLNGIRMRKWYSVDTKKYYDSKSIIDLCEKHKITLNSTPSVNCAQTIKYFQNANADIGLSLGNGYIGSKIFSIPKFGMINIHHEELPSYQNALSIIWQLYNNSNKTGYTIHKIDKKIDTGDILLKEVIPIKFKQNLKTTVSFNYVRLWEKSSKGLVKLLENYEYFLEKSYSQGPGKTYTTPNLREYLIILKNFKNFKKKYII